MPLIAAEHINPPSCEQSLDGTADGACCRGDTLDKFGVINLQMHQLAEELRPLLKFYAVHPKVLPAAS